MPERLRLWLDLIRWDRPAGWLLLLWPTLSALWIAADGKVDPRERRVFDHMLCRWGLTRSDVARALREPHRLH